ncbi:unnamed protein product [Polarella glacialis]|uniref:RRM domain-containing protein n=1 Tax=Polarella glacialis TaxID=89957 RepID=A0A813JMM7_POLGL|nr:unnamed protein product [Polarella glacialis]
MGCWEAQKGFCPRKGKGKGCKWCEGAPDSAGKGKGGGVWKPQFEKSWGSSWGGSSWGGKGKGKGKGKTPAKKTENALKVWVGGLPQKFSFKALQAHFDQAGKSTWAEGGKGGNGSVCYTTEAEKYNAMTLLNGSVFEGSILQVDQWVKKPTKADS